MKIALILLPSFIFGYFCGDKTSSLIVHLKPANNYDETLESFVLEKGNIPYRVCTTIYTSENYPAAWCNVDVARVYK